MSQKGFTLAEVLLTLTIIGVVAALTIPSVIANTEHNRFKAAWKKTFLSFDQATKLLMQENNGSLAGVIANSTQMQRVYANVLSVKRSCANSTETYGNCWFKISGTDIRSKRRDQTLESGWYGNGSILINSSIVLFQHHRTNCNGYVTWGAGQSPPNICGIIFVDVNGFSPPNVEGDDIFALWVLSDRILPRGVDTDYYKWHTHCTETNGVACSTKYLME